MKRCLLQSLVLLGLVLFSVPLWGDVRFESFERPSLRAEQKTRHKARKARVHHRRQARKPGQKSARVQQPVAQPSMPVTKQPVTEQVQVCQEALVGHYKQKLHHICLVARDHVDKAQRTTRSALVEVSKWIRQW